MDAAIKDPRDKWIPRYFVMFFAVIALLDGFFVYTAISTQTGIVTEHPYKKGLAFNDILQRAKDQPDLKHKASYIDGVLRWELPLESAVVKASIHRSVQEGYDFDITLKHVENGVYEARPIMPLPGSWVAKLKATWNDKQYQESYPFIVN